MFSFFQIRTVCFAAGLVVGASRSFAADLTPEQITIAESLDAVAAEQGVALAAKAKTWSKELDAPEMTANLQAAKAWEIGGEIVAAVIKSPSLSPHIGYAAAAPIIQTGQTVWRTARYSAAEYAGFTSANFREEARRRAERAAGEQLAAVYRATIFPALADVAEPADYVHRFATGRFREWTEKPLPAADGTLTFRVIAPAAGTPLLAPQTRLEIDVEYLPSDLVIRAQGLRFRHAAKEPQVVLDELLVEGELPQTVLKNVKKIGATLAGTRDAPIELTLRGKPDFAKVVDGRRGALSFDAAMRLFPDSPLAATGENFALYPGNHVDWQKNSLTVQAAEDAPVRIGRTPLALWSVAGTLDPTTAKLDAKATIGAFKQRPESTTFDVVLSGSTPIAAMTYEGALLVDGKRWLSAKGTIDVVQSRLDGAVASAPAEAVAGLAVTGGALEFEDKRLIVRGPMRVFGLDVPKMYCQLDLIDGSGRYYADGPFALLGADWSRTLDGRIEVGFKSARLSAVQTVPAEYKGIGDLWTTATVSADSTRTPPVELVLRTFAQPDGGKMPLDSFAILVPKLANGDLREKVLNAPAAESSPATIVAPPTDAIAKERWDRLQKLADAVKKLRLQWTAQSEDRRQAGRRSSRISTVHVDLPGPVPLNRDDTRREAEVTFLVYACGFTSEILPPSAEPVVKAAADVKTGRIVFTDFLGDKTPRIKIDLPDFAHGSAIDAVQRTRDELQTLVETYFPEASIDGPQRRVEKQLIIRNDAAEPISVWVVPHTRRPQDGKLQGSWRAEPLRFEVAAQSSLPLTIDQDQPLTADRVRLWAESVSGQRWDAHRYDEFPLVDTDPLYASRLYHAEQLATFVHTIAPPSEPQLFAERVVEFRNDSTELLHVKLDYQTIDVGISSQQSVAFDLKPDETLRPRDAEGRQIRASRIKFSADAENRRFNHNAKEPVWLVEEVAGRRVYAAKSIGSYLHVFLPHEGAPATASITAAQAKVMNGKDVVANARRGDKFNVLDRNEGWVLVGVMAAGQQKTGWIEKQHVVVENSGPPAPPQPPERTIRITAATANVQIGADVIGQVAKDQTFRVLQRREGWSRIEFNVDGQPRQGWIDEKKTAVE